MAEFSVLLWSLKLITNHKEKLTASENSFKWAILPVTKTEMTSVPHDEWKYPQTRGMKMKGKIRWLAL